jgi:putative membrane-bound dehydrogenase-like protein
MQTISMKKQSNRLVYIFLIGLAVLGLGYLGFKKNPFKNSSAISTADTLTDDERRLPKYALTGLEVADGLEVTTLATEPTLINPTNIDVDSKGRIWVCEAYNYRPAINGNPTKKEGDRILILEDKNGDGKADNTIVFYQGPEINSPLGISVFGNKVYVSQSPYIWIFTDENGDDKADKKEILFQGIAGDQHDHGAHAMVFGPDGKLYFNFGNEGKQLKDKDGNFVKNIDGREINEKNFKQGLAFRCELDGSNVEVLGQNFRNSFELAVDSFGTIWQTDNDDDGNKATRVLYVMQNGNYGYTSELTGSGWRAPRTNMEDSIPLKHWHLNDPGVVPNLLQTGAGSPSGLMVYEGNLLPEKFRNQMIHCEAGNNVVRAYPVTADGAGYKATISNLVKGVYDQWFRPIDVCAAPDGSIFVADWYDPGVGGHEAGDQAKGRIYRISPKNTPYKPTETDVASVAGAIAGLQSPNQAIRYLAYVSLKKFGGEAIGDLDKLYNTSTNPRMKARAFWLLAESANGLKYIQAASKDANPDIRIASLRASYLYKKNVIETVKSLLNDADAQVRRECALTLRHNNSPEAAELLAQLALKHNGTDRWNLEALGIGAEGKSKLFFEDYLKLNKNPTATAAGKDIVWRTRADETIPFLASLASNPTDNLKSRLRYFRAFDFNKSPEKEKDLLNMLETKAGNDLAMKKIVLDILDVNVVKTSPVAQTALKEVVNSLPPKEDYIALVDKYAMADQKDKLYKMMITNTGPGEGMHSTRSFLKLGGLPAVTKAVNTLDEETRLNTLKSLRYVGSKDAVQLINSVAFNQKQSEKVRKTAFKYLGSTGEGENMVFNYLRANKIPKEYVPSAVESVAGSWKKAVREEARKYLGVAKTNDGKPLPSIIDLLKMKGDKEKGKLVYKEQCALCHQVSGEGTDFGPNLSQIGSKLTKESIFTSIIHPDLGISFGYEGWIITLKDDTQTSGIIASKTETDIILKMPGGLTQNIKTSNIKSKLQMDSSVMPSGLQESMTTQQLVDLAEYMKSLK